MKKRRCRMTAGERDLHEQAIRVRKMTDKQLVDHLQHMLGIYKVYCTESQKPEEQRHYRVIEALYLAPKPITAEAVAAREKIDKRTVYKDIDAACATLSALIFGIDGIKKAG